MQVTYNNHSVADQMRCVLYSGFTRPLSLLSLVLVPLIIGLQWDIKLLATKPVAFIGVELLFVAGFFALIIVLIWNTMRKQASDPRPSSTVLSKEGVIFITPGKTSLLAWNAVKEVRNHSSDIYFWASGTQGVYVPRSAFADAAHAQAFYDAAMAAKRGDYSLLTPGDSAWQVSAESPPGVWPPPPSGTIGEPSAHLNVDVTDFNIVARKMKRKQRLQVLLYVFLAPLFATTIFNGLHPINPATPSFFVLANSVIHIVCFPAAIIMYLLYRRA